MMIKVISVVTASLVLQFAARSAEAASCDPRCTSGQGACQSDGRCLCWWGWTGPNAVYLVSGSFKNRILADYCTTACHYTHDYLNPSCASIPTPQVCSVPVNQTVPSLPCDPKCGTGSYHGLGSCLSNGRCLCWWGWTGPNACYVDGGTYNNRILADRCVTACHYTHVYRNTNCAKNQAAVTTQSSTVQPSTAAKQQVVVQGKASACDPQCAGGGQGTCRSDGRCFCWWGWTGPNAVYITSGLNKNRIVADYCTTACHYTHDYLNPSCASIPTPQVCSVPVNQTVPPLPCDPQCGTGTYHSAGSCLSNGHCLCWWGWTGPNACYVDGGTYDNRIIADSCIKACHYTHVYRNYNCIQSTPTTKPSTQPPSTGRPTSGKPSTRQTSTRKPTSGKPTTGMPTAGHPSTGKKTTGMPTTGHPSTGEKTTGQPSTGKKTTGKPTTGQPSTGKETTEMPTTKKQTTTMTSARTTTVTTKQTTIKVPPTTTSMPPTTGQKTTTGVTTSATAKATTTQPGTTGVKIVTSVPTTKTAAPTTQQKTTTQKVISTTPKVTTTEPTEPPEPTEPTEPGGLQVRGMAANRQSQLQNDVEVGEVAGDKHKADKKEKKNFSPTGLVIVMVVLLICVLALVCGVWWSFGNGNRLPSLWRGYEPVRESENNMLMREFSESAPLP